MMIEAKDGSIWAASYSGLHHIHGNTWITYTHEDGLPADSVTQVLEDSKGRIWAGTSRGLSLHHPDADPDPPDTYVPDDVNVREVSPDGELRVVFRGMDKWKYTEASRLYYSYRIDEEPWSPYDTKAVATFHALPAGNHLFEVRAMDRNGNVDPSPAVYEFTVPRYWHRQPAFQISMLGSLVLILVFAGIAVSRHLRLQHTNTALERSNLQLHTTTGELETANVELHTANEELLELDKMKSSFVSQASHDLRTPLTAIKGSLDNLMRGVGGGLNERQSKVMGRALRSVDRLTALINDVLDINRIETGRMVLEKSSVPFHTLVDNIVQENQPAAVQKGITLEMSGLSEPSTVTIDAGKIERVVGELVSNAIKYTPNDGHVRISLSCEAGRIQLSVEDNGIGMTPEECAKVFERFYRTQASQHMAKGSGLGLSIAKELVGMHGGTLDVVSEPGRGTHFTMTLPTISS